MGSGGRVSFRFCRNENVVCRNTGDPGWIRTSDPQLRRLVLYPAELRGLAEAKVYPRRAPNERCAGAFAPLTCVGSEVMRWAPYPSSPAPIWRRPTGATGSRRSTWRAIVSPRIERHAAINAFVVVDSDAALKAAAESQARWRAGNPLGLIDGVPASIKDNIWVKGLPTRRGSRTSETTPAQADSPAVARLREQGA